MLGKKESVERGRYGLYCIYDIAGKQVSPIMQCRTLGLAQRHFKQYVQSTGMPTEYELWRLGFLDIEYPDSPTIPAKTRLVDIFEIVAFGTDFNFDVQETLPTFDKTFDDSQNPYERG